MSVCLFLFVQLVRYLKARCCVHTIIPPCMCDVVILRNLFGGLYNLSWLADCRAIALYNPLIEVEAYELRIGCETWVNIVYVW